MGVGNPLAENPATGTADRAVTRVDLSALALRLNWMKEARNAAHSMECVSLFRRPTTRH